MSLSTLHFSCFQDQNKPEKSSTTCCSNFVQNLVNCIIRIKNSAALFFAKFCNLIGTLRIAKFGPKYDQVFKSNGYEYLLTEAPSSSQRALGNKRLVVISLLLHIKNLLQVTHGLYPFSKMLLLGQFSAV